MLGMYAPLIGAVLVTGLFAAGFGTGYKVRDGAANRERAAAIEAQLEETLNEVERGNKLTFKLVEANKKRRDRNVQLGNQAGVLAHCGSVPDHFVRLHDASASDTDMHPSGLASCSPSAATYDQVARTVIANYSIANDCRDQLNALIDFLEKDNHEPRP